MKKLSYKESAYPWLWFLVLAKWVTLELADWQGLYLYLFLSLSLCDYTSTDGSVTFGMSISVFFVISGNYWRKFSKF